MASTTRRVSGRRWLAAEDGIVGLVGVERGLELVDEVARGHPSEQLAARRRQTGIAGAAPTTTFLEQFLTGGAHAASLPRGDPSRHG